MSLIRKQSLYQLQQVMDLMDKELVEDISQKFAEPFNVDQLEQDNDMDYNDMNRSANALGDNQTSQILRPYFMGDLGENFGDLTKQDDTNMLNLHNPIEDAHISNYEDFDVMSWFGDSFRRRDPKTVQKFDMKDDDLAKPHKNARKNKYPKIEPIEESTDYTQYMSGTDFKYPFTYKDYDIRKNSNKEYTKNPDIHKRKEKKLPEFEGIQDFSTWIVRKSMKEQGLNDNKSIRKVLFNENVETKIFRKGDMIICVENMPCEQNKVPDYCKKNDTYKIISYFKNGIFRYTIENINKYSKEYGYEKGITQFEIDNYFKLFERDPEVVIEKHKIKTFFSFNYKT